MNRYYNFKVVKYTIVLIILRLSLLLFPFKNTALVAVRESSVCAVRSGELHAFNRRFPRPSSFSWKLALTAVVLYMALYCHTLFPTRIFLSIYAVFGSSNSSIYTCLVLYRYAWRFFVGHISLWCAWEERTFVDSMPRSKPSRIVHHYGL
jgi:hypothetical protein